MKFARIMFFAWPVWLLLLDLWFGVALNISQSLHATPAIRGGELPMSPDIAFNWLQVLANAGMAAVVSFGLAVLLGLNRHVIRQKNYPIGAFRSLGLLIVLAYSLPAAWGLLWQLFGLLQGQWHGSVRNLRYLAVAVLMPYPAGLCVYRLWGWYQGQQKAAKPATRIQTSHTIEPRHPNAE